MSDLFDAVNGRVFAEREAESYVRPSESGAAGGRGWLSSTQPVCMVDSLVLAGDELTVQYASFGQTAHLDVCRFGLRIDRIATAELPATQPEWSGGPEVGFELPGRVSVRLASARPGLYGVRLWSGEELVQVHPFVVETPPNQIAGTHALVANVDTWVAYNFAGGRSRYRIAGELGQPEAPAKQLVGATANIRKLMKERVPRLYQGLVLNSERHRPTWRNEWLSDHRPMDAMGLHSAAASEPFVDHLAGAEWRVAAWLEGQGLPVSFIADRSVSSTRLSGGLASLVLSTHSEYWTRSGWKSVVDAVRAGLNLINLSGNSLYGEIERSDSKIRCSISRLDSALGDSAPCSQLGWATNASALNTCSPFRVLSASSEFWGRHSAPKSFGEDSLLKNQYNPAPGSVQGSLPSHGEAVLVGEGASGWEVDVPTSSVDWNILARGENPGGGAFLGVSKGREGRGDLLAATSISMGGSLLIDDRISKPLAKYFRELVPG